jgi:hypothetical protein
MLFFFMPSKLIYDFNRFLYPEQQQQQILNFLSINRNSTKQNNLAMHSRNNRNQSHKFQTPEIPWKPKLQGKPANESFIISSTNAKKNDFTITTCGQTWHTLHRENQSEFEPLAL